MIHLMENKRKRPYDTLGAAIKHLRKQNGWTQVQLANRLELCQATIAHYESNFRTPPLKVLKKLSRELQCPMSLLADHRLNFIDD